MRPDLHMLLQVNTMALIKRNFYQHKRELRLKSRDGQDRGANRRSARETDNRCETRRIYSPILRYNLNLKRKLTSMSGAFALNASVAFTMKNANIQGSQIVLRSTVAYDAAAKASNSVKAFENELDLQIKNMVESTRKRLEIAYFYGGVGLGKTSAYTGVSATRATVTLSDYAIGIWSGSQDTNINFYTALGVLVSSGADAIFTIYSTDPVAGTVTVNGTSTGITALATAAGAGVLDLYFQGAKGNEMLGVDYILTTNSTIFGIDPSIYSLWKGNSYSCSSADLTMGKVLSGLAIPIGQGLEEDVVLFCNPTTWARLNTDLAALRRFDGSWKRTKGENGVEGISYYGQNGEVQIISHSVIKPNSAYALPIKRCKRIGSMDLTFRSFVNGQQMFRELSDNAGKHHCPAREESLAA